MKHKLTEIIVTFGIRYVCACGYRTNPNLPLSPNDQFAAHMEMN